MATSFALVVAFFEQAISTETATSPITAFQNARITGLESLQPHNANVFGVLHIN